MSGENVKAVGKIVIVGGGTAGWIAAASLAKLMGGTLDIRLIESDAIGTIGVGEATIPQILNLNSALGIDEKDFLRRTNATFKLGIEFSDWGHLGERYLHTFGWVGLDLGNVPFHHYWARYRVDNPSADYWNYSLHHAAAYSGRFAHVDRVGQTSMSPLHYAYHFDAGAYAAVLRERAEADGVVRTEGRVVDVALEPETGFIQSVTLDDGEEIYGDLFIDCTGFRALLIGEALGVGYQDWSHWLPVNRAFAVQTERVGPPPPYTKAMARDAGWQWRIPLQHRTGNGHVFCDAFTTETEALDTLLDTLDGSPIMEPKPLRFGTGRREALWHKNCVSLGLASGFLEPLESTSIHIIQSNVSRLIELFPDAGFSPAVIAEYNRVVAKEYDLIRDFLILHYCRTDRDDTPFWRHCANMDIPDSLTHKIELFRQSGHLFRDPEDLFREASWVQVMMGQGIHPESWHRRADALSDEKLEKFMSDVRRLVDRTVSPLPAHADYVAKLVSS
ncbi:MAG: tryptophan halogenase family protein [Litorimonas sp.]